MTRIARIALTAAAVSLGVPLAGCDTFDPTAILDHDFFNTKKKLPGERKPVFPDGTPGVPQGVPQELVKGYQATEPEPEPAPPEPKAAETKPKPKPKPKVVAKPKEPAPAAQPPQSQAQTQWPDPPPTQQSRPTAGAWPSSPQPSGGGVAWPDPPPMPR